MGSQRVGHDLVTEQQQSILELLSKEFFNPRVLLPGLVLKPQLNKFQNPKQSWIVAGMEGTQKRQWAEFLVFLLDKLIKTDEFIFHSSLQQVFIKCLFCSYFK